jgi:hypothetical protein
MPRRYTAAALLALVSFICLPSGANAAELYGDESGEIHYVAFDGEPTTFR